MTADFGHFETKIKFSCETKLIYYYILYLSKPHWYISSILFVSGHAEAQSVYSLLYRISFSRTTNFREGPPTPYSIQNIRMIARPIWNIRPKSHLARSFISSWQPLNYSNRTMIILVFFKSIKKNSKKERNDYSKYSCIKKCLVLPKIPPKMNRIWIIDTLH